MEGSGSRIGIVFNGSPLFTGDAGRVSLKFVNGLSRVTGWNALYLFLTGCSSIRGLRLTFGLNNKKSPDRKGKFN